MARNWIFKCCFCVVLFLIHFVILFRHIQLYPKAAHLKWKNEISVQDRRKLLNLLLTPRDLWEPNVTEVARYRAELRRCCNASFHLVLTKENTPPGSNITCMGDNAKVPVGAELLELLPERSPFSCFRYKHCALVGNGGILRKSRCGREIDQADLVVRFNLPPMNFPEDVGTKTSLVTINPSILKIKFHHLLSEQKSFADALRPYRDALFLIPAFTHLDDNNLVYRALYAMEELGLTQKAFFLNPQYQGNLHNYWKNESLQPQRLSSGFIFISMALEFCQCVTLYGFWPFSHDLEERNIAYHYYDDILPDAIVHDLSTEFSHYLHMYTQNVLHLRYGKCH